MALNFITLVLDLADGTGTPLATGQALPNPPAQPTDATGDMIVTKTQPNAKPARVVPAGAAARHRQHHPAPSGWARTVSFAGTPGTPQPFTFFLRPALLLYRDQRQPAMFTAVGSSHANGTPVVLAGSSLPGGFAGRPPD